MWNLHEQSWGSFASCASISSALFERVCSVPRGRLKTGLQGAILPHKLSLIPRHQEVRVWSRGAGFQAGYVGIHADVPPQAMSLAISLRH
jgi:hypothetical protein